MDSKEGLSALFHYANEGILVTGENGNIVKLNPAAEKMFGYDPGELLDRKVETLIPHKYAASHIRNREEYAKKPVPRAMGINSDLFALRKDMTVILKAGETRTLEVPLINEGSMPRGDIRIEPMMRVRRQRVWNY